VLRVLCAAGKLAISNRATRSRLDPFLLRPPHPFSPVSSSPPLPTPSLSLRPIFAAKVVNGSDLKVKTDFQTSQLSLVKCHQIGDELRTLRCLRRQATSSSKKSANSE